MFYTKLFKKIKYHCTNWYDLPTLQNLVIKFHPSLKDFNWRIVLDYSQLLHIPV